MTTVQHKDEFVTKRQPTLTGASNRYAEASKRLRKMLRDEKVYEVANAWALEQCKLAEQFDWSSRPSLDAREVGSAAIKLADRLEGIPRAHMDAAERESGVKLGLDAASLAKYLRAFAKQCDEEWDSCGPLFMKFTRRNQVKMPPAAVVLTIGLAYGFKRIPDCIKTNVAPFRRFNAPITSTACLPAAVLFANAALGPIKEQTNVGAVKQWRKNNRGRFRWVGFRK